MEIIKIEGEVVAVDITVHMDGGRYVAMLLDDKEIINKVLDVVHNVCPAKIVTI
ncbi:MAG: hypothetical protein ACYCSB_04090 [bacterium]